MTDQEFDVLDELYFVTSFTDLQQATALPHDRLKDVLLQLFQKGWLKVFKTVSEELPEENLQAGFNFEAHYYLASKAGLFAHNGR